MKSLYHYRDAAGCGHFFVGTERQVRKIAYATNVTRRATGALLAPNVFVTHRGVSWFVRTDGTATRG